MVGLTVLDLMLILALLSYLVYGLRNGFLVTVGGLVGFAAGAVAAFFAVPLVSGFVADSGWRLTAIVAAAVVLVVLGHGLGTMVGRQIRGAVRIRPLRAVDRLVGGAVNVVVSALVMSMLAFSVSSLGVPVVSQQLAESKVIRFIDGLTPIPGQGHHGAAALHGDRQRHPHPDRGPGPGAALLPFPTPARIRRRLTVPPNRCCASPGPRTSAARTRPAPALWCPRTAW